jgi:Tfp pilus assembly protein PilF
VPRSPSRAAPALTRAILRALKSTGFRAGLLAVLLFAGPPEGSQRRAPVPADEEAYRANNLGVALLEQFKFDEATAAFRQALRREPNLGIAHLNLSIALLQNADFEAARGAAETADRLMPGAAHPPYVLALIAREQNRDEDAIRFLERVRQIDPRDTGAAVNLGQIHIQNRRYAQAIALLEPAFADEPYSVTAAYNLGMALLRSGQQERGQQLVERSQSLRATGYGTTFSNAYLERGKYAEALASTGAERELVDRTPPGVTFNRTTVLPSPSTSPGATSPFGRQFQESDLTPEGARRLAASLGGALTMIDVDGDGDRDVVVAIVGSERLFRNDAGRFIEATPGSGLGGSPADSVPVGVVAGDIDNDGIPDLFILRYGRSSLYKNDGKGHFTDVTASSGIGLMPFLPGAAALVDVDHDGDLDLVVAGLADIDASRARAAGRSIAFPDEFAPAPVVLIRNNGDGTFTDITREAKIAVSGHAVAIVPTDFDNHRDVDLLVVRHDAAPVLLKNLRDGSFTDVAAAVGLGSASADGAGFTAVTAGDVNKDGYPDFYFGRAQGPGVLALSDRGRFVITAAPTSAQSTIAGMFVDYDNDGLLDLLTWSVDGPHVARNLGTSWSDETASALAGSGSRAFRIASSRALGVADLDGDGRDDFLALGSDGAATEWRSDGAGTNRSIRVRLKGRVSNRSGLGSKVQIRAGSLEQRLETSATTPMVAPADLIFGLGKRAGADVIRVQWPSGVVQAESAGATAPGNPTPVVAALPSIVTVEELNRKPSSCPFLYTWNGERFEFVTDFLGGGEMGYWERPRTYNRPDPIEFVRIRQEQLQERNGRYEIRVTNELEETLFLDRLQLIAVDHPQNISAFPNEGMTDPPKPLRLFAVTDQRVPAAVTDGDGHDITERIAGVDRRYADGFGLKSIRGYASPHDLVIELGSVPPKPVLLLTGWTDYAFSSDNVAAHQAGLDLTPPRLDVRDAEGRWRPAIADIGIPVGRPQTIVVDLAPVLRAGEHTLRVTTNMRIYWDQISLASAIDGQALRSTWLAPLAAFLRSRGFSQEIRPGGSEPPIYDYDRVTTDSPWKTAPGLYTREGDVQPLLSRSDDMFVVAKPGDEIALSFDASTLRPLPSGWTRTFLLKGDGFSKEMDVNSASPDRVEPLPFHRMSAYPYRPPERYPDSVAHRRYRARYNTRRVTAIVPLLQAPH